MKKVTRILIFLWALVLLIAVMIFFFSSQDGETSAQTSAGLTQWFARFLHPELDNLSSKERWRILREVNYLVRKAAHFTEFALLGASLRMLFEKLRLRFPLALAWVAGTLYAGTDELHQYFVGTRSAMIQDVGIDSAGVLFGAGAVTVILLLARARKKQTSKPDNP